MNEVKLKRLESEIANLLYEFSQEEGFIANEIYVSKHTNGNGDIEFFDVSVVEENC